MALLEDRLAAGEWPGLANAVVGGEDAADEDLVAFLGEMLACHIDPAVGPERYEALVGAWVGFCLSVEPGGSWPEGVVRPWWLAEDDPATLTWNSEPAS